MYHVSVFNAHQHRQVSVREGMTRIGRAPAGTSDAGYITVDDLLLDATQLELQQVRRDIVQVGNVGGPAVNVNGEELNHGEHRKLRLPVQIQAGRTHLWIAAEFPGLSVQKETVTDARDASGLVTSGPVVECYRLPRPSLAGEFHDASATSWPAPAPETLAKWFSALAAVQREIPGSRSFHDRIVEAIVRTGGLDAGLYLEPSEDEWRIIASCVSEPPRGIGFDSSLVDAVNESGETIWTLRLDGDRSAAESSEACVATPVFDEAQRVVGVLYGSRVLGARNRRREVRPLEARWLQVLAESVTSGIARARAEVALARQRVILEQSFPSSVVKQILRDSKNLLQSEEREVTILFVDLIESSVISEQLDSRDSDCLLGDLLDCLTRIVQDHEGVIVDYYGDGLVAMWNAPLDQSDHMLRACRSGLQMISEESALSARWQPKLHRPLRLGVGIHCGTAWVGNSGSRFRLKYGPRGKAVTVASRVEKATRCLPDSILLTEAARRKLPPGSLVRRLGRFRLDGIPDPTTLYALHGVPECERPSEDDQTLRNWLAQYEWTLRMIESGRLEEAMTSLETLVTRELHGNLTSLELLQHQLAAVTAPSCRVGTAPRDELVYELSAFTV